MNFYKSWCRREILAVAALTFVALLYLRYLTETTSDLKGLKFTETTGVQRCGEFPRLVNLNISDTYWQVRNTTNGTFYLYGAYYDDRSALGNASIVRILALVNVLAPQVATHCQLWYDDRSEPQTSPVHEYRMLWPKAWGENKKGASPFILSCANARHSEGRVPQFVSLVEGGCDVANNLLPVRNKRPANGRRGLFVVSVKKLDFDDDISLLLIEWCEILKILAVDRVEVFVVRVHANTLRVLRHYEDEGLVRVKFLKYPSELPNKRSQSWHQWIQNELICLQDTFFENLYSYEFMVPMDTDEFILPARAEDRTWRDLLTRVLEKARTTSGNATEFDAFPALNQYFLLRSARENETVAGVPRELRFLSNVYRARRITPKGGNVKAFLRLDRVLAVHNHFPFSCVGGASEKCKRFEIDPEDGHLCHYRDDCLTDECAESKAEPVRDTTLWKFKGEILRGVGEARQKLGL